MPWMYKCVLLALLCLVRVDFLLGQGDTNSNTVGDSKTVKIEDNTVVEGSGVGRLQDTDDEDLIEESASGSGSGFGAIEIDDDRDILIEGEVTTPRKTQPTTTTTTTTTTKTTTLHPKTECEKTRETNQHIFGQFVPYCLPNGDYDWMQCDGSPGTTGSMCRCVDLNGHDIPGTLMESPEVPECKSGENLSPCVHELIRYHRQNHRLLGAFLPVCALDGTYEHKQCHGNICYCVDENTGKKIRGTDVHMPDSPNCDGEDDMTVEYKPTLNKVNDKEDGFDIDEEIIYPKTNTGLEAGKNDGSLDIDENLDENMFEEDEKEAEETNETDRQGSDSEISKKKHNVEEASEIMTQPGILAGIIGGSVVLLLCLVLLVMFIVYRMRKKDEGSYPLDEPSKRNYSYAPVRAPEREFYA